MPFDPGSRSSGFGRLCPRASSRARPPGPVNARRHFSHREAAHNTVNLPGVTSRRWVLASLAEITSPLRAHVSHDRDESPVQLPPWGGVEVRSEDAVRPGHGRATSMMAGDYFR